MDAKKPKTAGKNTGLNTIIAQGLKRQPAYLLVFGCLVVIVGEVSAAVALNNWVLGLVLLGPTVVLVATVVFLVERKPATPAPAPPPPSDQEQLSGLPQLRRAMSDVLGPILDNSKSTYFVYSATPVKHYYDHAGKLITYPFLKQELEVTTILDAEGIARIHSLLYFGGKNDRLSIVTSNGFRDDFWGANLILIGSGNSNTKTQVALSDEGLRSPYLFSPDMKSIRNKEGNQVWPTDPKHLDDWDYAVLAKLVPPGHETRVYLVAAGIGPTGTLAACHYLDTGIAHLHSRFGKTPFALVLKIKKSLGSSSAAEAAAEQL